MRPVVRIEPHIYCRQGSYVLRLMRDRHVLRRDFGRGGAALARARRLRDQILGAGRRSAPELGGAAP